jgi:hypothetical protein
MDMSIAPFSTPGRFWRGNLHTRSRLSDGALAPEQVIAAYKTPVVISFSSPIISWSVAIGRSPIRGADARIISPR